MNDALRNSARIFFNPTFKGENVDVVNRVKMGEQGI